MFDLDLCRVLDLHGECPRNLICRHEACELEGLHRAHRVEQRPSFTFRTRSKRHIDHPWQAQSAPALRDAVYNAVSLTEPRSFQMILHEVRNDYGSCLERSVHRHLSALRDAGSIVRLEWKRIYAYLQPKSRLLDDPEFVCEQILAARMA